MTFPASSLRAIGGDMYAHLFENPATGLARDVFWSFTLDFAPVEYADEEWRCSLTMEWIRISTRSWKMLGESGLVIPPADKMTECSFCMYEHDSAEPVKLALERKGGAAFAVEMAAEVQFGGYVGGDEYPNMPVSASVELAYEGLVVVPGSFSPKPATASEVLDIASPFIDVDEYEEPVLEGFRYVMHPRV